MQRHHIIKIEGQILVIPPLITGVKGILIDTPCWNQKQHYIDIIPDT